MSDTRSRRRPDRPGTAASRNRSPPFLLAALVGRAICNAACGSPISSSASATSWVLSVVTGGREFSASRMLRAAARLPAARQLLGAGDFGGDQEAVAERGRLGVARPRRDPVERVERLRQPVLLAVEDRRGLQAVDRPAAAFGIDHRVGLRRVAIRQQQRARSSRAQALLGSTAIASWYFATAAASVAAGEQALWRRRAGCRSARG